MFRIPGRSTHAGEARAPASPQPPTMAPPLLLPPAAAAELRAWLALAVPGGLRALTELLPWLCSLAMIGRVGTLDLSALSLTEA